MSLIFFKEMGKIAWNCLKKLNNPSYFESKEKNAT